MPYGLVDDKLHSSVKWRMATKGGRALWITALSWCMDQLTDGRVPKGMLRMLDGSPADARSLVAVGLWETAEGGWQFHDWLDYQPDAASIRAKREKESEGGQIGNHVRWHVRRKLHVPECEFCQASPPQSGSGTRSGTRGETRFAPESSPTPTPNKGDRVGRGSGSSVTREDEPPQLETSVPRHVIPAGWVPNTAHKAYAGERGIDLGHELHQFRAHCKSKRVTSLDWDAEFDKWLGNARSPRGGGGAPAKRTTSDRVRTGMEIAAAFAEADGTNVVAFPQLTEGA